MKVVLIGTTGFTGKAILLELLDRDHFVTAIARHPEKLGIHPPSLTTKAGNMLDEQQVIALVKGHDAVVSAYNPGWTNPKIYEEYLEGAQTIQAGVKKAGVKRLLVVGGASSLEIKPGVQLIDTPEFPTQFKAGASGGRDYLGILKKEKELDWTYFSPAILMNSGTSGVRKGVYRTGLDQPVFDQQGKSVLSVEDLAVAVVDELEHPKHIRQRFTAAY